jgi:hypothetical protein
METTKNIKDAFQNARLQGQGAWGRLPFFWFILF